jgi:hypothetical protein
MINFHSTFFYVFFWFRKCIDVQVTSNGRRTTAAQSSNWYGGLSVSMQWISGGLTGVIVTLRRLLACLGKQR